MSTRVARSDVDAFPEYGIGARPRRHLAGARGRISALVQRVVDAPLFYAAAAAAGLTVGRLLTPDPRGLGTHEALGLPPCLFQHATGLPCPGCGMTTAVSHAAHGDLLQSFLTQPAGFLFAVGLAATLPLMLYAAVRGLPASAVVPRAPQHPLGWGLAVFPVLVAAWVYKLIAVALLV